MLALTTVAPEFSAASLFFQQRHPAGAALQAILGTDGVAKHQDRLSARSHGR
jgi:hypothetical protein